MIVCLFGIPFIIITAELLKQSMEKYWTTDIITSRNDDGLDQDANYSTKVSSSHSAPGTLQSGQFQGASPLTFSNTVLD